MRVESSVTAISWIPSEAVDGLPKLPFSLGLTRYDDPPPDRLRAGDLDRLRDEDAFRLANELRAFVDFGTGGGVLDYGQLGRGHVARTPVRLGARELSVAAVQLPTIRPEPEVGESFVRFTQTCGRRPSFPAPRIVHGKPYFQVAASTVWTTLALTIHADGSSEHELVGASTFPRHWIYDRDGTLVQKSGLMDFEDWYRRSYGENTPWGEEDLPAFITEVESALERELSTQIMRGGEPPRPRRLDEGELLVEQSARGDEVFLLLDGVVAVEVDDEVVAEIGPGAIVGERAVLEGGRRTATLRALTPLKVVPVPGDALDPGDLDTLAAGRRREDESA